MSKTRPAFPRIVLSSLAVIFAGALAACAGDLAAPDLAASPHSPMPASALEGSYESRAVVHLHDGRDVTLVQVHFGNGGDADGHTFLAQVATAVSTTSSVALLQRNYSITRDTVRFEGGLLTSAVVSPEGLTTRLTVDGEEVVAELRRIVR